MFESHISNEKKSTHEYMDKYLRRLTFISLYLQEGANINKSLTTLGKVISALAEVVCGVFTLKIL